MNRIKLAALAVAICAGFTGPALADTIPTLDDGPIINVDPTAAVPEPASWATMIVGFAVVGVTMRRRRTVRADA